MPINPINVLYTAVATAENGRDGRVSTDDGKLDVVVNKPKELGGNGAGTNPEQLFAAGYSACFQGALSIVAEQAKADISGSTVTAQVGFGIDKSGGYGITVELTAKIPNVDQDTARELLERTHQICPYSKATRGNIDVVLNVA